jgi:prepilin-type N-terminal cleavage/methylation domain-containing protein
MITQQRGFTLIELILFIVVSSILASTILLALSAALHSTPVMHNQVIANQLADQCMEWYIGQRRTQGYSALSCPSTPSPSLCGTASGFTVNSSIACTTINSDSNYKTITVTVSGAGSATLNLLIAGY